MSVIVGLENGPCGASKSASKPGALAKSERFFFEIIPTHGYTVPDRIPILS